MEVDMNPELTHLMARARYAEMRRVADPGRGAQRPAANPGCESQVTLRYAGPADQLALLRLAELDSARPLSDPVIVAESFGKMVAALSLRDRRTVADPFEPTAALVDLLIARARQLEADGVSAKSLRLARLRALLAAR
jgi:hypothetical protein